jgi:UDP-N-acetylglucosamine:LPS N-acetylglucosamine transferase
MDPRRLKKMSAAMANLATPEAAFKIAALIHQMAETPEGETQHD